jgi:hypothetical protein
MKFLSKVAHVMEKNPKVRTSRYKSATSSPSHEIEWGFKPTPSPNMLNMPDFPTFHD